MKRFVLAALILTASASASFAADRSHASPREVAANTLPSGPKAAAVIGRDGQDTRQRCSNENPNIEYRDCVNASTRDPNAKIRMS